MLLVMLAMKYELYNFINIKQKFKDSIIIKIMKTITNKFKIALAMVGLLAIGTVSAQQTTGNIDKQTEALPASGATGSIR